MVGLSGRPEKKKKEKRGGQDKNTQTRKELVMQWGLRKNLGTEKERGNNFISTTISLCGLKCRTGLRKTVVKPRSEERKIQYDTRTDRGRVKI